MAYKLLVNVHIPNKTGGERILKAGTEVAKSDLPEGELDSLLQAGRIEKVEKKNS